VVPESKLGRSFVVGQHRFGGGGRVAEGSTKGGERLSQACS